MNNILVFIITTIAVFIFLNLSQPKKYNLEKYIIKKLRKSLLNKEIVSKELEDSIITTINFLSKNNFECIQQADEKTKIDIYASFYFLQEIDKTR